MTDSPHTTPPPPDTLTLLHFGDLHLWSIGWDWDPAFKRLLGLTNLVLRRGRKFPFALAYSLIERIGGEQADFVLFTGDLTTTALRREFSAGRQLLRPISEAWGERFIALPGNHDRYTRRAVRGRLFESLFLETPGDGLPLAMDLDARWTLVAFDCSVARQVSSRGHLAEHQLARLEEMLAEQQRRGRHIIAAGHYPLVYPPHHRPSWEHVLPQREALWRLLHARGVRVYLHGHAHHRWRLEEGGLTHLNCGPAGMNGKAPARRPGYLKITLGAEGLESVQTHWLRPYPHQQRHAAPRDWAAEDLPPEPADGL